MALYKRYLGDLFLPKQFYFVLAGVVVLFVLAWYLPLLEIMAAIALFLFFFIFLADYALLFFSRRSVTATRETAGRFSNGDENPVEIILQNDFGFKTFSKVIDELPVQFQLRNWQREIVIHARSAAIIRYKLTPLKRGEYHFGDIHVFVNSPLKLVTRRISSKVSEMVPVYPAFLQLHKYQLMSQAALQEEHGSIRRRKIGQSLEFEQIRDYVTGDDIRTLNWKASARRGSLMINNFMDERSQQVYCVIDKGRLMKMPFGGMSLLDYAINSCLVLSSICLRKQDKVGLITFSSTLDSVLPADRKPLQRENILRLLYNQETNFLESDFEMLYMEIRHRIKNRSLVILYTNFESMSGLNRQLDYLRAIASHHLLLVVFFENSELGKLTSLPAENLEDVYIKTVAEKFAFEKRLIARELGKYGILSLLTSPQNLTVQAINKYLEIKSRQAL